MADIWRESDSDDKKGKVTIQKKPDQVKLKRLRTLNGSSVNKEAEQKVTIYFKYS